jgi:hypothetical protein
MSMILTSSMAVKDREFSQKSLELPQFYSVLHSS